MESQENFSTDLPEMTGTTIMAVKYNDGVIIGADCRTSMGTYVSSRFTDKLTKISDNIYCCRSGSAADTQAIAVYIQELVQRYSFIDKEIPSVKKAAMAAKEIISKYDSLLAGLIIAGYDDGPKIFNISLGGTINEAEWQIGGSGSGYIYGFCDINFKPNMTLEEAMKFVQQSITCAIRRDNASGGCIRMATITKEGVQRYICSGEKILSN
ncbi:hypothetical protein P3W45_000318 [Vairimorpha bombi]|jgi:20S proteasome subunit beta 1